ncbi:MAG: hypothetical protein ABR577_16390 [Pyrinomonadaceae bacterium]
MTEKKESQSDNSENQNRGTQPIQSSEVLNNVEIPPVEVRIDPPKVKAGQSFKVKVTLADFVGPGDRVFLMIKFQRILFVDGQITLRSIDYGYLDPNNYPAIIDIRHPENSGESSLARVKPDASQPAGYPPVSFPEDLLITVYIEYAPHRHCSEAIRISPAID